MMRGQLLSKNEALLSSEHVLLSWIEDLLFKNGEALS